MMTKIKAMLLCLMLFGLAEASEQKVMVHVTKESGEWLVSYQLPQAVNQVFFYREGSLPRGGWGLSDADLTLTADVDKQHRITGKQGKTFDRFSVRFASDYRTTPKDYELNFAFTDGGELLYTGHLLLALNEEDKISHDFTFKPEQGHQVIIHGQVDHEPHQWTDSELKGTYVYFGQAEPVESEHMLAVMDPGLPEWINSRMVQALPKLFAFYTQQTGMALNFKPVVFFSFTPGEQSGTQYSGGTLPGLIQLNVKGNDWQQNTPNNLIGVSHFLAHEAAHLWNSQLIVSDDDRDASWIHEGGADAFAVRALAHLGVLTDKEVLLEHEKYLNQCIDALKTHPVTAFEQHRNFSVYYHCGATIAWLTELALQRKKAADDLFDFWATMMQRVSTAGLSLTTEQYFKSMLQADQQALLLLILTLLEEPQVNPNAFFTEVFQTVGLSLSSVKNHAKQSTKAVQSVLQHLMMADCNGYSFNHHGSYYSVGKQLQCQHLKPGMQISHIMGLPIKDGHGIHAKVKQQCALGMAVELSINQSEVVSLECNKTLPELRSWLSLTAP